MKVPVRKNTKKIVFSKKRTSTLSLYELAIYPHLCFLPNDIKRLICNLAFETIGVVLKKNTRIFYQIEYYTEIKNVNQDICGFCLYTKKRMKVLLVNNGKFSMFPYSLSKNDCVKAAAKKLLLYKTSNEQFCVCIDNKYHKVTILDGLLGCGRWQCIVMPRFLLFVSTWQEFEFVLIDRKTCNKTKGTILFLNSPILLKPLIWMHEYKNSIYVLTFDLMLICAVQNHKLIVTYSTSLTKLRNVTTRSVFVNENLIYIIGAATNSLVIQTFQISGNKVLFIDCQSKSIGKLNFLHFPWFCHETEQDPFFMENLLTGKTFCIRPDGKGWSSSLVIDYLFMQSNDDLIYRVYDYPKCRLCKLNVNDHSFKILHEYEHKIQIQNEMVQTADETVVYLSSKQNKTLAIHIVQ